MDKKIIIFSHPRSGSNSLGEILSLNPAIKIMVEPFNPKNLKDYYPSFLDKMNVNNEDSLNKYLKQVFKEYNGIKTHADQLPPKLNELILLDPNNKIIFLTRKNLLQTVISMIIGQKTGIWYANKDLIAHYKEKLSRLNIGYIDSKIISQLINKVRKETKIYRRILKKNKIRYFNVHYEDLFTDQLPFEIKIKRIKKVFEFLGYSSNLDIRKIEEILNPENKKMADETVYLKVQNIYEIEAKLGCKKNGYLFETEKIFF